MQNPVASFKIYVVDGDTIDLHRKKNPPH